MPHINDIDHDLRKLKAEVNAQRQRKVFTNRDRNSLHENICSGRADWNACDYIDYRRQDYSEHGALCWNQEPSHKCVRLSREVK